MSTEVAVEKQWDLLQRDYESRIQSGKQFVQSGKLVDQKDTVALLEAVIKPGDKVSLEGDNQKQADFLAESLCKVDVAKVHDLHMVQ